MKRLREEEVQEVWNRDAKVFEEVYCDGKVALS